MLNNAEWKQFERLCNGEYMTQVEDAGFEAALEGVKLAFLASYSASDLIKVEALRYLHKFGNWRNMALTEEDKAQIAEWNGE